MHPIGWLLCSAWLVCYMPSVASILLMGAMTWGLVMLLRGIFRI